MTTLEPEVVRVRDRTVVMTAIFLGCVFLSFVLPLYADSESIISTDGAEIAPLLIVGGVVFALALGGRKSPVLAGIAAGVIALIGIVYAISVMVLVLLMSILGDFGTDFGAGIAAIAAAVVFGAIAVFSSGQGWAGSSPRAWTPVAVGGACAVACMLIGTCIPPEGVTFASWTGFDAHALVGILYLGLVAALAAVGIAGFSRGRWGVGLVGGFIGFILLGWLTSQSDDQSAAFGLSGVDGGSDFHVLTVLGFWAAAVLFVVHAIQQLATPASPATVITNSGDLIEPPPGGSPRWAADPYQRSAQRYFDGRTWTTTVADSSSNVHDAPATPMPPASSGAAWYDDPLRRHQHRYFDGTAWTSQVADGGVTSADPPIATAPASEAPPVPTSPSGQPDTSLDEARRAGAASMSAAVPALVPPGVDEPHDGPAIPDETVPRPSAAPVVRGARIRFSDGRVHSVNHTIVVGRDPSAPSHLAGCELMALADQTVSKTHAAIGIQGDDIWVCDLGSSNGVALDSGSGERRITPGTNVIVAPGTRVVLGDAASFIVEATHPA